MRYYSPKLRQALRLCLAQQQTGHSAVFGLWRDRPADALELEHALRAERSWWAAARAKLKSFKPGLKASPACPLMTPLLDKQCCCANSSA
jgi:hypothetical protein